MACGWRWPHMTTRRVARLRRTGAQLPVRMGIATGEAELRGADYFGAVLIAVVSAAATRAAAIAVAVAPARNSGAMKLSLPIVLFGVRVPTG
jgi:class 3 adenylate cyclase